MDIIHILTTTRDWPVLAVAFPMLIAGAPLGAVLGSKLHSRDVAAGRIAEEA